MAGFLRVADRAIHRFRSRYRGPTWDWPAGTITRLSYDMRARELNGIPFGAPLDALRPLGPAGWFSRSKRTLELSYYRLGLIVNLDDGRFDSIEVLLDPARRSWHSWHPFAAARIAIMNPEGKWADLTGDSTEDDVASLLGAPTATYPEDERDERDHHFKLAGHYIDTTHVISTGRLVTLEISTDDEPPAVR